MGTLMEIITSGSPIFLSFAFTSARKVESTSKFIKEFASGNPPFRTNCASLSINHSWFSGTTDCWEKILLGRKKIKMPQRHEGTKDLMLGKILFFKNIFCN